MFKSIQGVWLGYHLLYLEHNISSNYTKEQEPYRPVSSNHIPVLESA